VLLALDTATEAVTAAVHDGHRTVAEATELGARRHGELLAPLVEQVLAAAEARVQDLDGIVVGVGPGPFTSLRVGVVTGIALALPYDLPVHGVCSLDALARDLATDASDDLSGGFVVATDARRREVYWAEYDAAGTRLSGPSVDRPATVAERLGGRPVTGAGPRIYRDLLGPGLGGTYVCAGSLAEVAAAAVRRGDALLPPRPLYLRRPDATEPQAAKPVLA
jgi:tRNA threonylcarbamoyl adenosine modification protein YeaZ